MYTPTALGGDACAASATAEALTQAVQQPGPSAAASCSAATVSRPNAAALSPAAGLRAAAVFNLVAEQGQQVWLTCAMFNT